MNEITKLKNAIYYNNRLASELLEAISLEASEEELENKLNELVESKLYVEKNINDVIEFQEYLIKRSLYLKDKKAELNGKKNNVDNIIDKIENLLIAYMEKEGFKNLDVNEYQLTLRKAKSVNVDETNIESKYFDIEIKIPYEIFLELQNTELFNTKYNNEKQNWKGQLVVNKERIRRDIEKGEVVIGAYIDEHNTLLIK